MERKLTAAARQRRARPLHIVVVTFCHAVDRLTVSLTPYETTGLGVVWRCGNAPVPANTFEMGTSGGGNAAVYIAPTVPNQYVPASCRS